jgi:hypothetical protein
MEEEIETRDIERNVFIVRNVRKRIVEQKEIPTDHNSLAGLLHLATEDVLHPGHNMTLVEIMTAKSVAAVKPNGKAKGPQPVVEIMDREADEIGAD